MQLDDILETYPKTFKPKQGASLIARPLRTRDEKKLHLFFCGVPETERLLFKHRVTERKVIHDWCTHIDYGRIFPLLAVEGDKVGAVASLHQQLAGWKRHIGRLSVVVHPDCRGRGVAAFLVHELIEIARNLGLERLEAEFMGEQHAARHVFANLGFSELLLVKDYVKDMQALPHDYVLMGRPLITDEEYASAN